MSTIDLVPGGLPFTLTGDEEILEVISTNKIFPIGEGKTVIGQLGFKTPDGSWTRPGMSGQSVTFTASSTSSSQMAAYTDAGQLATDLGFQSADGKRLKVDLPSGTNLRYMSVNWNLQANAAGSGKLVLDPALTVNFGANGDVNTQFAFIRAVDVTEKAGDACRSLATSWMTPGEIAAGEALPGGCWIIAEADGTLSADVGVQSGYNFNWVKATGINQLDGDIGLRVQLGLQATLTACIAGKFYVVISRDPNATATRVRMFRDRSNGWGFALDSSADVIPSTSTLTPEGLADFIKALLGTHDAQLIDFLSDASSLDSADGVAEITNELGNDLLTKLGVAGDAKDGFTTLSDLLTKWNDLGSTVAATVWKYADNVPALNDLHVAATTLANASDDSVKAVLDSYLHDTSFCTSPIGEWLETASSSTLLQLYDNSPTSVHDYATKLLKVLDGSGLQSKLGTLKTEVNKVLDLPTLQAALQNGNLFGIASWVQERLAKFLGVDKVHLPTELGKAAKVIDLIEKRADDIYKATVKALNTSYGATLTAAYQASDESSALVDATFEDGQPAARTALEEVLLGRLGAILAAPVSGVKLSAGTLTHSLTRHTHVEAHLPWWTGAADDLATATASTNIVDGVNGRVQFFECSASDVTNTQRNTDLKRFATCSIGLSGAVPGVRTYNPRSVTLGYSFVTTRVGMTPAQLRYELTDAVQTYFPRAFKGEAEGPQSFGAWILGLSKVTGAAADEVSGRGVIGTVWTSLQVNAVAADGSNWISQLLKGVQPDYHAMSCTMQTAIRRSLLKAYGADPRNFKNIDTSEALLVYAYLPALNDVQIEDDRLVLSTPPKGDIVWDTLNPELVRAICQSYSLTALGTGTQGVVGLLKEEPDLKGSIEFYDGQAQRILSDVLSATGGTSSLERLLQAERTVINDARSAFEQLQKAAKKDISVALPQFSSALVKLVETFNKELSDLSLAAPEVMRNFAPLILQQAVWAMFSSLGEVKLDALLDLAVLKGKSLPATGDAPAASDALLRQRITNFG